MRELAKDKGRLMHILESVNNIYEFVEGHDSQIIFADKIRYFAIVYQLVVIGEAANLLTDEFRSLHKQTPWREIINMRNFIVHGYNMVDKTEVLSVINDDLPILKKQVEEYLKELLD